MSRDSTDSAWERNSAWEPLPSGQVQRIQRILDDVLDGGRPRISADARLEPGPEIGRGGMGVVRRAWDPNLRRTVAMKSIRWRGADGTGPEPPPSSRARLERRFLREARVTGQLSHPGVIPVHQLGIDDHGQMFFTMPEVHGRDLGEIFRLAWKGEDGWSRTRALASLQRVCEVVAYAHERGVIHRDLKPGNVMVGAFGETYVLDWGLAKIVADSDARVDPEPDHVDHADIDVGDDPAQMTVEGTVLGTASYMAPEQAAGRIDEIGAPADIYAVGAMIYTLLAEAAPYERTADGQSSRAVAIENILAGPPHPIGDLARDAPPELISICEKAMARRIADRYPTMGALGADIRAFLENRAVWAHRTGALVEFRKWVARNRLAAAALLAAFVGLLALAVVTTRSSKIIASERDRVLSLADVRTLRELQEREAALFPPVVELREPMRSWLREAEGLLARRTLHERRLAELGGRPVRADTLRRADELRAEAAALEDQLPRSRGEVAEVWQTRLERIRTELRDLEPALAEAETAADLSAAEAWQRELLAELAEGLEQLPGRIERVRRRLALSEEIESVTTGADGKARWQEAIADIAELPVYGGLRLEPQPGLLPLRRDPASGLWEFWHVQTGPEPQVDDETGRYDVSRPFGIVLVLIPGGTFRMGSRPVSAEHPAGEPNVDPWHKSREGPVHEVTLAPFFLSKYELTQAQWERADLPNRSVHVDPLTPVLNVTWEDGERFLRRTGLCYPTEAQWEYACRAGSSTVFSFGDVPNELSRYGNVASLELVPVSDIDVEPWNDGNAGPARVGGYAANRFGLHDMHGNVSEWCLDWFVAYRLVRPRPGDGLRGFEEFSSPGSPPLRTQRDGSWRHKSEDARAAQRYGDHSGFQDDYTGVRPARAIDSRR